MMGRRDMLLGAESRDVSRVRETLSFRKVFIDFESNLGRAIAKEIR